MAREDGERKKRQTETAETVALLDGDGVVIHPAVDLRVLHAGAEDVLEAVERHLHDLGIHHRQQVAQRRDAALVDEETDLVRRAARHGVGDRPGRLLAGLELRPAHHVDQRRDYVGVDHRLQRPRRPNAPFVYSNHTFTQ